MNTRVGHWADPTTHRDGEFDCGPVDHRVSKAEQEDDHAGQPFGWLLVALAITVPCALLGFWMAS